MYPFPLAFLSRIEALEFFLSIQCKYSKNIYLEKRQMILFIFNRGLDLSPYTKTGANESPPIYDLYGVVNHYGGILGGHYTSFVRTPDAKDPTKNEMGE